MPNKIFTQLQHPTTIERQQQLDHQFVEDLPAYAINSALSREDHAQVLNNYFFRNRDVYISRHNRYADYPLHTHSFIEMNYMLRGTAHEQVNGKAVTLRTGDLLILDVGSQHAIAALGENDLLINILFRSQNISATLLNDLKRSHNVMYDFLLEQVTTTPHDQPGYLHFTQDKHTDIQTTLWQIIEEYYSKRDFTNTVIQSYLSILFIQLVRAYPLATTHSHHQTRQLVARVLRAITIDYPTITLANVATRLNYNKNYLSNIIKATTGQTFSAILTQERLRQARILIQSTDRPITKIMHQVGISNSTFFYHNYQKTFHLTPKTDRNRQN